MTELQDNSQEKISIIRKIKYFFTNKITKILTSINKSFVGFVTVLGAVLGNITAGFFKSTDIIKLFHTAYLWCGIIIIYNACMYFLPFFNREYIFFLVPAIVIVNKIFNK